MKQIFLLVFLAPVIASCTYDDLLAAGGCDADYSGPKSATLQYDDNGYNLDYPKLKVKKKSLFILKLKPSKEFRETKITTKGKKGELPDGGGSTDFTWLDTEDPWSKRKSFVFCVPDVPEGTIYEYSINIPGLAFIDPRLEVTR